MFELCFLIEPLASKQLGTNLTDPDGEHYEYYSI